MASVEFRHVKCTSTDPERCSQGLSPTLGCLNPIDFCGVKH